MIYYIFMLSVEGNLYAMLCNVIYLNAQMKDRVMTMKITREKMEEIEKITNNIIKYKNNTNENIFAQYEHICTSKKRKVLIIA